MGNKAHRMKMKQEERAKQFAPFAALKGFEEAIVAREKIIASPRFLDEDKKNELDRTVRQIKKGNIIRVVYDNGEEFIELHGMLSRVDIDAGLIKVVNTKIFFKDIYDLEITE